MVLDYHCFSKRGKSTFTLSLAKEKLKTKWRKAELHGGLLKPFFTYFWGKPNLPRWIEESRIDANSQILDIGCGDGTLLFRLRELGFKNLSGINRHMQFQDKSASSILYSNGEISSLLGSGRTYDLIMLHHSLEHMDDQPRTLKAINELLEENGSVVIRIPLVSGYFWHKYGTNWFQLDAPRHFYLHTPESFQILINLAGFKVESTYYDSSAKSLLASEQYAKDIPFLSDQSFRAKLENSIFNEEDMAAFSLLAEELNETGDGDQACFILKKK